MLHNIREKQLLLLTFLFISPFYGYFAQQPAKIIHDYYHLSLTNIKNAPGYAPPVAARCLGYLGLGLYEATQFAADKPSSIASKLNGNLKIPTPQNPANLDVALVANEVLYQLNLYFFQNCPEDQLKPFHFLHKTIGENFGKVNKNSVQELSTQYGKAVSQAIITYSESDGGKDGSLSNYPQLFNAPVMKGKWQPQDSQLPLLPYWGKNRTFVKENGEGNLIAPPPVYSEAAGSDFYNAANEVYKSSKNITQTQRTTVFYWSDGWGTYSPAGHTIYILLQILKHETADFQTTARTLCQMGIGLSDAFVACWEAKYRYNLIRPVDYIRSHIDSNFHTVIPTPPFPEYPSGHATQAGAATTFMNQAIGIHYPLTDSIYTELFGTRHFYSFNQMSEEISNSRLWAGIHYTFGNQAGTELGKKVVQNTARIFENMSLNIKSNNTGLPTATPLNDKGLFRLSNISDVERIVVVSMSGSDLYVTQNIAENIDLSNIPSTHYYLHFHQKKVEEPIVQLIGSQSQNNKPPAAVQRPNHNLEFKAKE